MIANGEGAIERLTNLREVAGEVNSLDPAAIMWDKLGDIMEENVVVGKLTHQLERSSPRGRRFRNLLPHYYGDDEYKSWGN